MERYIFIAHGLEETILLTCQYFNFSYMSKDSTKFQTKSQQGSRIFFFSCRNQKPYSKIYVRRQRC